MAEIAHVEGPVCDHAKRRGFYVRKCSWVGRRGAPDRLFYGHGVFWFIEFKDAGEVPEPHQEREIQRMRENGIPVHVIDNREDGCALIDRYLAGPGPARDPRADPGPGTPRARLARLLAAPASDDPADEFF